MPDVFISYAREDRDRARLLADALQDRGWSVWWDRKIVAGEAFDQTIEQQLETAGSVVVLWSAHSIGSEWVRNEAGLASEREVLVPALIEHDLVDELQLSLYPVTLGGGKRILPGGVRRDFQLTSATPYPTGVVGLRYARRAS